MGNMVNEVERMSTLKDKIQDYDEAWNTLGRMAINFNWNYRQRVCLKCPLEQQQKRKCFRVDNYRTINDKVIQETHCDWLQRARANKLRKHVKAVFNMNPFTLTKTILRQSERQDR